MARRLLIVEDDADLLEQLTDTLEDAGYHVTPVASSQAALEWAARGEELDLVVTDVRMAGLDGIQAFERLRESRPDVRGVVMTGYASEDAPRRAVSAGAWDYLYKPFSQAELLEAIDRVVTSEQKLAEQRRTLGTRLWDAARKWVQRVVGKSTDKLRQRAWWAFYAGIRSRLLERSEALAVYDELERIELGEFDDAALDGEYRKVLELIEGLKADSVVLYWESERRPEQVSKQQFDRLFARVAKGQIAGTLLPLAPALRTLPGGATDEQKAEYAAVWL